MASANQNPQMRLAADERQLIKIYRFGKEQGLKGTEVINYLKRRILLQDSETDELQGEKQNTINWKNIFKQ